MVKRKNKREEAASASKKICTDDEFEGTAASTKAIKNSKKKETTSNNSQGNLDRDLQNLLEKTYNKSGREESLHVNTGFEENDFTAPSTKAMKKSKKKKDVLLDSNYRDLPTGVTTGLEENEQTAIPSANKKKSKKKKDITLNSSHEDLGSELETLENTLNESRRGEAEHANIVPPKWPEAHMSELLRRMENLLPQKDQLVYKSRVEKLNWTEIAFENYTAAECRLMWETIQKRLRKFRLLNELIEDAKGWITKPWTTFYGSNKTNRHPDMPKRPLSTYMLFYMKKRDKVLQENPGLEVTGISKHIAQMYKNLPQKTKDKYNKLAADQRKEYAIKMKEFYDTHPDMVRPLKGPNTVNNGNTLPKPVTPFRLFYEDLLAKHKDKTDFDKAKFLEKCKDQWKNLSDKKKVFWIDWAVEREHKYQEQMKNMMLENPEMQKPLITKSILTKEERMLQERMAGKPEKPPNSAYSLFSRLMLTSDDVKKFEPKERMQNISQQWKNLTEADKKQYSEKVKHMLEQYKLQYAEYLEGLPEEKRQEELLSNQPKKKKHPAQKEAKMIAKKIENLTSSSKTMPGKKPTNKPSPTGRKFSTKPGKLYEDEPDPPPVSKPFLLFAKNFEEGKHGSFKDAQDVWDNMNENQQGHYKKLLSNMKKTYIEKYEMFLKGLTKEELTVYSDWKKSTKQNDTSDESDSDSSEDD